MSYIIGKDAGSAPYFPDWAEEKERLSDKWVYAGWIKNPPCVSTFDLLCNRALISDHGEKREIDFYSEGATCWYKEAK